MTASLCANHEAERALIGILIVRFDDCREHIAGLKGRDFDNEAYRAVYRTMMQMHSRRQAVDLVTLSAANPNLDVDAMADAISGALVTTAQVPTYVRILKDCTARRDFAALGKKLTDASAADEFDAAQMTEKVRLYLKNMGMTDGEDTGIQNVLAEMYDKLSSPKDRMRGITMGLPLDKLTSGFKPSRLYVVGARPGVGKTVFGLNAALKCALDGKTALYFNREMEKTDLMQRMTARLSGVSMGKMETGSMNEEEWERVADAVSDLGQLPIHVCNGARTPAQIRSKVSEIHEKHGLGLVVIDYLQRLSADGKYASKDQEIGEISKAVKDLTIDFGIPVILLSQLNRSASNVRPNMSMLRESGNIEQDADVVILLHAPDAEDVHPDFKNEADFIRQSGGKLLEMIVDKNRHGEDGIMCVGFYGAQMKYEAF